MTPKEIMQLVDVIHAQAMPLLKPYLWESENVATCMQAIEDLRDTLECAFADIDVVQGEVDQREQNELKREIEFRHNVILG